MHPECRLVRTVSLSCFLTGSSGFSVSGIGGVRTGGRRFRPGSLGSLGFAGFIRMGPRCRRVRPGWLGSLVSELAVVDIIHVRSECALKIICFVRGHWGGFILVAGLIGVVGIILCRWIHCDAH